MEQPERLRLPRNSTNIAAAASRSASWSPGARSPNMICPNFDFRGLIFAAPSSSLVFSTFTIPPVLRTRLISAADAAVSGPGDDIEVGDGNRGKIQEE